MMPDPLPPELRALERELAARPRPEPPADLRSRVLSAVMVERPSPRPTPAQGGFGWFVAATAAAVLLAINLSASVANDTGWCIARSDPGADVAETTSRVRALDPDTSHRDAVRQAILLHTAAGLTPAPVPAPAADRRFWNKDADRWDMP